MPLRSKQKKTEHVASFKQGLSVLALGPHADDVELGCGATLLYLKRHYKAKIHYVVFSDHFLDMAQRKVNREKEIKRASRMLGVDTFACCQFEDTKFPNSWRAIQNRVQGYRELYSPDIVFAPRLNDNHQDHITVAEAVKREFRHGQLILHYEIKQFGQDHFDANVFVDVSGPSGFGHDTEYQEFLRDECGKQAVDSYAHRKVFILRKCMTSQLNKPFLNRELLLGTMRHRGMQCSPDVVYAEAFAGRIVFNSV